MHAKPATLFRSAALAAALACVAPAAFAADPYVIDANHTQVQFSYTHFGFSHITGRFDQVEGDFLFDAKDPTQSSIQVNIPIASISTGVKDLDEDLRSSNFFDASQFPTATFQSTTVTAGAAGHLAMAGDLTIHGVTKPVTFDVVVNKTGMHPMKGVAAAGFDATATVKRSDFGIAKYVPNVSDEIVIHVSMEVDAPKAGK